MRDSQANRLPWYSCSLGARNRGIHFSSSQFPLVATWRMEVQDFHGQAYAKVISIYSTKKRRRHSRGVAMTFPLSFQIACTRSGCQASFITKVTCRVGFVVDRGMTWKATATITAALNTVELA